MDENNKTLMDSNVEIDLGPIIPDGVDEDFKKFFEDDETNCDTDASDGMGQTTDEIASADAESPDANAPATGDAEESNQSNGNADDELQPDGDDADHKAKPRTIQYRRNHKDEEFDPFADPSVTKDLIECGYAYKARQEKDNQEKYIDTLNRMMSNGEDIEIAEMAAERAAHGNSYSYETDADGKYKLTENAEPVNKSKHEPQISTFDAELNELNEMYKSEGKNIPDEVNNLIQQGVSPFKADRAYQKSLYKKTVAAKDKEITRIKQQTAAAKKAPVSGVTNAGVKTEEKDYFMAGFDSFKF